MAIALVHRAGPRHVGLLASLIHRLLVAGGIDLIPLEAEEIQLLGLLALHAMIFERRMALLLHPIFGHAAGALGHLGQARIALANLPAPGIGSGRRYVAIAPGDQARRRQGSRCKIAVGVEAQLLGADGFEPGDHHQLVAGRQLHHLALGQEWPGRLLPADHDMGEPRRQTMPGIVAHGTLLGCLPQCIGDTLGGAFVIRGEGDPDMTIVEYGIVLAVGLVDLVEALRDEEGPHPIARHEGKAGLEEIKATERGKLIEHEQELVPPGLAALPFKLLGKTATDLIEHQADERLGAADVRRRHDEIEGTGLLTMDQVGDPPVAA